jgi:multisubunit Na+/H+ antiporter MnhE subunit
MRQYGLTYAAMVVVFGFIIPNVDNVAHVGGFITGALVGVVAPPLRGVGGRDLRAVERIAVYLLFALAAAALVVAALNLISALGSSPGLRTAPA